MKLCIKCDQVKEHAAFVKNRTGPHGIGTYCRPCHAQNTREHRAKQPPKIKKRKGPAIRFNEPYEVRNKEKILQRGRDYYQRVRKARNQTQRAALNAKAKELRSLDPEKYREHVRRWAKNNPDKEAANRAKRRAARRNATVPWADYRAIQRFYAVAKTLSEAFGVPYEVDHIVPLRGGIVCGLHWQGNLQIIPANDNRKKGNRVWPDMP